MNVTVVLLDGGQFEVENFRKDTLGKEVFKNTCNKIGLTDETDYFGLRFINKKDAEFQWVDNERTIKSQLGKEANDNVTHYLHFAVKFFPVNPTNIKNDITRYQFVLQLRESLLNGRLECSSPIYALLGSFIAQAEFGDYDSPDLSANYLEDFRVCPDQPPELIDKVRDYHRRHKGMNPEQAELNFLDNVRKLPMYGVHRHLALDVNCEKVFIGVSNVGVTIYRGNRLMSTFVWPQILSIGFKSKKFYIKIKPADEDDDFCKTSVGFKLSDRVAAKRLWRICVEHHTFFRLENVGLAEKKGWLSRFGSRFSYKGKTEHEIMKEEPKPSEEPFNRVSSRRFSERVLKGNRRQDSSTNNETEESSKRKKETKSEREIPSPTPAIEISPESAVVSSSVKSAPDATTSNGSDKLPEIKVVQPSPELKTRSNQDEEGSEKPNERTEDSVKEGEESKQPEPESADVPPEDMIVISNPLAGGEVKSYTSQSITTTTSTTQSSSDVPAGASVSTVSVETTTQQQQVVTTTTTTTSTVVQSEENLEDIGLV